MAKMVDFLLEKHKSSKMAGRNLVKLTEKMNKFLPNI